MQGTFSLQSSLAKHPVPSLESSCNKLLEWSAPLLTEQEFRNSQKLMKDFLASNGEGEKLQKSLLDWGNSREVASWSNLVWFEHYLKAREPLVIDSNVFYYLKSKLDTKLYSQSQIASALILCAFDFAVLIENNTLSIERQKDQPLCMAQYKNLFSTTRIPKVGLDELSTSTEKKHIIVLSKGHIYKLDIVDNLGDIHSFSEIDQALNVILRESQTGQNIGILTTTGRDEWADTRSVIIEISESNKSQLNLIETALFTISLDETSPEDLETTSQMLFHGNGKDRYFDKSIQFIVFKNGRTGINYEHSGLDGSIIFNLISYIYNNIQKIPDYKNSKSLISPENLFFEINNSLETDLKRAAEAFSIARENTQTRVLNFKRFGKNQIKKYKISPDAFVQIALQLAEFKLYGKCYSAYEAIMTRSFLEGRIDVLYAVSNESLQFIQNMNCEECDRKTKIYLLNKAAEKHISRAEECRLGEGIDNHFMGLISRFEKDGEILGIKKLPEIFNDNAYKRLTHSVVCTSTTSDYGIELAGFGPVVENGYGIRYFKRADSICFNITARTENRDNLEAMVEFIEESLIEMAELMQFS